MNIRKFKYLVFVTLLILLAGCATTRIAPETVSRLKRVGVISVTAHEFYRRDTGLTVFGNEREMQDISAWKVDDEYELQMQAPYRNTLWLHEWSAQSIQLENALMAVSRT